MSRKLIAVATFAFALAVAVIATRSDATTTWSQVTTTQHRVNKATCTTGTETGPTSASDGVSMVGQRGFSVSVHVNPGPGSGVCDAGNCQYGPDAAANMTAGGTLQAWVYNAVPGAWARDPSLDLTISPAATKMAFTGFSVPAPVGRIAYVPSGIGQPVDVYIVFGP